MERPANTMSSAIQEKAQLQRGQASVKGSTETMRMVLLAFSAVGITYEPPIPVLI